MTKITLSPWPWNCSGGDGWIGDDNGEKVACYCDDDGFLLPNHEANKHVLAAAPELLDTLIMAVELSGFSLSGPTDWRAAEDGEPRWVCTARGIIAKATRRE